MNDHPRVLDATALALVMLLSSPASADHGAGHAAESLAVSLEGAVVDVNCFALRRAAAMQGRTAADCEDGAAGHPVGLRVKRDGRERLYILATPPMALRPHMGRTARLHGVRSVLGEHLVRPDRLEVEDADGQWHPVALLPDM